MEQNTKVPSGNYIQESSTPIPSLEHFSSGNLMCFNSREKISDQLFVALKDDSSMIGLYGSQGSAKFDPEDIGIPCNSNRCKILLTTCCQKDCDLLSGQREIQLDPLSRLEAWSLFQKHSCFYDDEKYSRFDLLNVAYEVALECEGLPRTIKDVGSFLKSRPIEEWKTTLDILKHSMAKWQIFLSFRGEDTRYSFTGYLYQALSQAGFKTFMDDGGLHTGDQISPSL
ncbi:TIR-similar-domain-containing protein TSDC, partial [Trifolium pratense]